MQYVILVGCLLGGYLLGSLNASIIFGKLFRGADIRQSGSKNAGMTNTLRVFGKSAAAVVFLFDLVKAIIAVLLAKYVSLRLSVSAEAVLGGAEADPLAFSLLCQYMAGLGAVLGHNFPLYFSFKGGKGILASWGVIMILDYRIAIILLVVFVLVVATTRYVSLASITSAIIYPLFVIAFNVGKPTVTTFYYILLSVIVSALAVYRHRSNIKRLTSGTESKLGEKQGVKKE
ncbi:MAG: glycerol-3-phosphate 1-O-acyltransferase PlsY [Ruminococcaceae bacterium]|nr:glycerol-3-phosphate 1-O-acyltransferase PlsY [Oscillospiraceae bacterium]